MSTISGEVTLDGQPLASGQIQFRPVDDNTPTAGAEIKDGKFEAQVPQAKMQVQISAPKVIGKRKLYETPDSPTTDEVVELIPPQYNVNSKLALDVLPGKQTVHYDLKSK